MLAVEVGLAAISGGGSGTAKGAAIAAKMTKVLDRVGDLLKLGEGAGKLGKKILSRLGKGQGFDADKLLDDLEGSPGLKAAMKDKPELVDAWEVVSGHGVRKNAQTLERISNLTPEKQARVAELYDNLKAPAGQKGRVNFTAERQVNGNTIQVDYDNNGFPDFTTHSPGSNYAFVRDDLVGTGNTSSGDFGRANTWAREQFGENVEFDGQRIIINDIHHTWHHHQDGKTMYPVPTKIHSSFSHSGGKKIIEKGLKGLFDGPQF